MKEVKIGSLIPASTVKSKKSSLNLSDFHKCKLKTFKLAYGNQGIASFELIYSQKSLNGQSNMFYVDKFAGSSKSKDLKELLFDFEEDEEIIEIWGKIGNTFLENFGFQTSKFNVFFLPELNQNVSQTNFNFFAPIGFVFSSITQCSFKEYIEGFIVEEDFSVIKRYAIYKELNSSLENYEDFDFEKNECCIDFEINVFKQYCEFEKNQSWSFANMKKEILKFSIFDKLAYIKYLIRFLILKGNEETDKKDYLIVLQKILRNLKYPQLLLEFDDKKICKYGLEESFYEKIMMILILVRSLIDFLKVNEVYRSKILEVLMKSLYNYYCSYIISYIFLFHEKEKFSYLIKQPIVFFAPHLGFFKFNRQSLPYEKALYENELFIENLSFRKINAKDLFFYERQTLVHCFQTKLFDVQSIPSVATGFRIFKHLKERPKEIFFVISYNLRKFSNIIIPKETDLSIDKINHLSFSKHFIASLITNLIELYPPKYILIKRNDNDPLELCRVPYFKENDLKEMSYSGMRNPLFFMEIENICNGITTTSLKEFQSLNFEYLFVEFLCWVSEGNHLISFEYYDSENNKTKKKLYSLSGETIEYLYKSARKALNFILDHPSYSHLYLLFALNPVIAVNKNFIRESVREGIKRFENLDFDHFIIKAPPQTRKQLCERIRIYDHELKLFAFKRGEFSIILTIEKWIKSFLNRGIEIDGFKRLFEKLLMIFPMEYNSCIYEFWRKKINWSPFLKESVSSKAIIDTLLKLGVKLENIIFTDSSKTIEKNLLQILAEIPENQIEDLEIIDTYINGGLSPDKGYPFQKTAFEICLNNDSHSMINRMMKKFGGGRNVNFQIALNYVNRNFEKIGDEKVLEENIKELIGKHKKLEWEVAFKLMACEKSIGKNLKKLEEADKTLAFYQTLDGEVLKIDRSKLDKVDEGIFIYTFECEKNLFTLKMEIKAIDENSLRNISYHHLETLLFGNHNYSLERLLLINSDNQVFEVTEDFSCFNLVNLNSLNEIILVPEQTAQRIILNILLMAGELLPEQEKLIYFSNFSILYPTNPGKYFLESKKNLFPTLSYLFCLEAMTVQLPEIILKKLLQVDAFEAIQDWLKKIENLHFKLSLLQPNREVPFGFWLKKGHIKQIYFRLLKIQSYIANVKTPTFMQVLMEVDSDVADAYNSLPKQQCLLKFNHMRSLYSQELQLWKFTSFARFIENDGLILNNDELVGPNEARSEFLDLKLCFDKGGIEKGAVNWEIFDDVGFLIEILGKFDFAKVGTDVQEKWLEKISKPLIGSQAFFKFRSMTLKNFSVLNSNNLEKISLLKQIRYLRIQGSDLGDESIPMLACLPLLEVLDLSFSKNLINFSKNEKAFLKSSQTNIAFNSLKHLNLSFCENLSTICIKADIECVSLEGCRSLTLFNVDTYSNTHEINFVNLKGASLLPEKEVLKLIKSKNYDLVIDYSTSKEAFKDLLAEFPNYPKFPPMIDNKKISGKFLDYLFTAFERKENAHLLKKLALKEMNEAFHAKICQEINSNLSSRGISIVELDLSGNTGIKIAPNLSMLKSAFHGGLPNVEILNLSQLKIGDSISLKLVSEYVKNSKVLKKLTLDDICDNNSGFQTFIDSLKGKTYTLRYLSIKKNGINPAFISNTLANFLSVDACLIGLDLSFNYIDNPSFRILLKALAFNRNLEQLILKNYNFEKLANNKANQIDSNEERKDVEILPSKNNKISQNSAYLEKSKAFVLTEEILEDLLQLFKNNMAIREINLKHHNINENALQKFSKSPDIKKLRSVLICRKTNVFILPKSEDSKIIPSNRESFYFTNSLIQYNSIEKNVIHPKNDFCCIGLSIDGGGMRGIIPATMLEILTTGCKYSSYQIFDYIGGTSIGGIMALGLTGTHDGKTPIISERECINLFESYGKDIFGRFKNTLDIIGLQTNKFDESGLESVVRNYFKNTLLSDSLTNVLVTSVYKSTNEMFIFDSQNAFRDVDQDFFRRNVARATSAAPTFFSSAEFSNISGTKQYSLVDGGLGKNDPSSFVFGQIERMAENYGRKEKFMVISLGTGEIVDNKVLSQNPGLLEIKNILNKSMDVPMELEQRILKEKYGNIKYRRFQPVLAFNKNVDISLDNYKPEIVKAYRTAAEEMAQLFNLEDYGSFQNVSLVDWLAENTARKLEII